MKEISVIGLDLAIRPIALTRHRHGADSIGTGNRDVHTRT